MSASRAVQVRSIRLRTVAALSTPIVILFMFMMSPASAYAAIDASAFVPLANQDRVAQGLSRVTSSPLLVAAAQAKADDMAAKGYFAHTTPEGYSSWHWFKLVGYAYSHAGENLAQGYSTASEVETAWLNSPTHRANIMNGAFTEVGIATAVGTYQGKQVVFVAQMFGTPHASAKEVTQRAPAAPARTVAAAVPAASTQAATTKNQKEEAPAPEETLVEEGSAVINTEPASDAPSSVVHASLWQRLIAYIARAYEQFAAYSVTLFA